MAAISRIIALALAVSTALLFTAGCGNSAQWVGTWKGKRTEGILPQDRNDPIANTMSTVVVTIKSDGSFDMITQGVPLAGVARMKKDKVTLVVKEQLGSKLPPGSNPEAIMELQEDGTVLFLEGRFDPVPMTRATEDDDKS